MKKKMAKKKSVKKTVKKVVKKLKKSIKKKVVFKKKLSVKVEKPIGVVTHFYTAIKVAIVKFKQSVKSGAKLRIRGATTDFVFTAVSLQLDHKPVKIAPKGKQIGIKVPKRVREADFVYLGDR